MYKTTLLNLLLGRPLHYDRRVMHYGVTNKYSFKMNGRPISLVSWVLIEEN
jgi:hypothetical protein